ncbi:MAG: hypothetical protein B6247_04020 [Candidatus Parabeggiatoa sp. nov. 2]|nr:MAG: hypothetical protein B6247_04020 [Beggiatoa sp. 4572_84]
MAGFLLAGSVRFGESVGSEVFFHVGEAEKCEVQPQSELKNLLSRQEGTYGQVISSVALPKETEISITLRDLVRQNLATAFLGEDSDINLSGGTVTQAVILRHNVDVVLKHHNLSTLSIDGATEGTDYLVNLRHGFVKALPGGSIADKSEKSIIYTYADLHGFKIKGAIKNAITVPVLLTGTNLTTNATVRFLAYQAILSPSSPIDFLSEEFAKIELKGTLQIPEGQDSPFEYIEIS